MSINLVCLLRKEFSRQWAPAVSHLWCGVVREAPGVAPLSVYCNLTNAALLALMYLNCIVELSGFETRHIVEINSDLGHTKNLGSKNPNP